MPNQLALAGGQPSHPTRYAPLWNERSATGLWTQRNPLRDAASTRLEAKFYGGRNDGLIDGLNAEVGNGLTMVRRPGLSVYNSQTFDAVDGFYEFRTFSSTSEDIRVMVDTATTLYDGTGPSRKLNIWNKSTGAGQTLMQSVGDVLYFADGVDQKKWVLSALSWQPNTLYDGAATSDTTLGDFIIDQNGYIQQAVGGFTLLISEVAITGNVLTLTLDTSQLADPSGTPTGIASTTGGNLPAGNNYIRIAGVDATGNVTEAGNESAAVVTTGTTSQIIWSWPAISGAVGYQIYVGTTPGGETTYFTSATNSFTQTAATSVATGTPPTLNNTSVDVPDNLFLMKAVNLTLSGLTVATFLNGQTITITSVLPGGEASNQITAAFMHADYPSAPDTGTAVSGSGITGATEPTFATTLGAVTQDGGAQWINRSFYVENWGIAAPAVAPTIFQTKAPALYERWQPNTTYWRSGIVSAALGGQQQLIQGGVTGSAPPTWNTSSIGAITIDGTAQWSYQGPGVWSATTAFSKDKLVLVIPAGLDNGYFYRAQNAGISGPNTDNFVGVPGALIVDGSINWVCLGKSDAYEISAFTPSRNISAENTILDSNGYLQQIQDNTPSNASSAAMVSGTTEPTWGATAAFTQEILTALITAYSGSGGGGTATVTANNVFPFFTLGIAPGEITIAGLTVGTALNGIWPFGDSTGTNFLVTNTISGSSADSGTATFTAVNMWLNIGPYAPVSTGSLYWVYAYKNSVTGHVSTASAKSVNTLLLAGNFVNVSGFGSADPQVDTIVIYRTVQGGSIPLEVDEIVNPGGGVAFSYLDTTPDVDLNAFIEAAVNGANNPPLVGFQPSAYHLGRIWGFLNNTVYYSGGPDTTTGNGNEAFPPTNFFVFPSKVTRLWPSTTGIFVFTVSDVYLIQGEGTTTSTFFALPFLTGVGLLNYNAFDINGTTIYLFTSDSQVVSLDTSSGVTEVGFPIGDQFETVTTGGFNASLYDPSTAQVTWHIAGSTDKGLYVTDSATGWFRLYPTPAPETGLTWSTFAGIAGGCSAVQSVETSPGRHNLLAGPKTTGPILKRDDSVYTDNGAAYAAYFVVGSLVLAQPGQLAEIVFLTMDSDAVGTRPVIEIQLDEIAPHSAGLFEALDNFVADPTELAPSVSIYAQRFYLSQTQQPALCRHLQIRVNWGSDAVQNQMLSLTIFGGFAQEL